MFIDTKFPPVNIISNLILTDLYQARQILKQAIDDQLQADAIIAVDRCKVALDNISRRVNDHVLPPEMQEDYAAIDAAEARNAFNIANLRHKFLSFNGKNFLVTLTDHHQRESKINTKTPYIVAQKIKRAVRDTDIVHIDVTLFEHDDKRVNGVAADVLLRSGTASAFLDRMLELNSAQYLQLAQYAADPDMLLKFARRPPQESDSKWFFRSGCPSVARYGGEPL